MKLTFRSSYFASQNFTFFIITEKSLVCIEPRDETQNNRRWTTWNRPNFTRLIRTRGNTCLTLGGLLITCIYRANAVNIRGNSDMLHEGGTGEWREHANTRMD